MTAAEAVRDAQPTVSEVLGLLTLLRDHSRDYDKDRRPDALGALLRMVEEAERLLIDGGDPATEKQA